MQLGAHGYPDLSINILTKRLYLWKYLPLQPARSTIKRVGLKKKQRGNIKGMWQYRGYVHALPKYQNGSNFCAIAPKMRQPDFLELTVCDNCDLATANETMSLLITSFVSDGTASSNASNHTLLTAGGEEIENQNHISRTLSVL